jgi:phage gp45-like
MPSRNVTDAEGRTWVCKQEGADGALKEGQDVNIVCTTATVTAPLKLSVGWQWTKMADNGLARLIATASPVPRAN